jgi:hypothetical protein
MNHIDLIENLAELQRRGDEAYRLTCIEQDCTPPGAHLYWDYDGERHVSQYQTRD